MLTRTALIMAMLMVNCTAITGHVYAQEWEPIGTKSFEAITSANDGALLLIRYPGDILRSSDSGETWSLVYAGHSQLLGFDHLSLGLPPEMERGIAVTSSDSGNPIISRDSGRSWQVSSIDTVHCFGQSNRLPFIPYLLSPLPEGTETFSFADSSYWAVGKSGLVCRWDGSKWRELHCSPYSENTAIDSGTVFAKINFARPDFGAIALGNRVYFTYDSGVTWWRSIIPDSNSQSTLFFIDDTCSLVGMQNGKLYSISNTDRIWVCDTTIHNSRPILQIGWQDAYARQLFALTDSELFTLSTDLQVETSSPLPLRFGERALHASFPNEYLGFLLTKTTSRHDSMSSEDNDTAIISDTSAIYRSLDGGGTWSLVLNNIPGLTKIFFENVRIGYACGENGLIMATNDSGSSWTAMRTGTKQTIRDIRFVNDSIGYAVGDSGTVLFTCTYGKFWLLIPPEPMFLHPKGSYTGIAFPTSQSVCVVGSEKGYFAPITIPSHWRYQRPNSQGATILVSAYPDPSSGPVTFDVRLTGSGPTYGEFPELNICDLSGKSVLRIRSIHETSTSEWRAEADLSFLQMGIYTAVASYAGQTGDVKFYISK